MSFKDCVGRAMDANEADREKGERAQKMWKELADIYEEQGHPRHIAEVLAGEDVKAAFRKEAGDVRHVFLSQIETMRRAQHVVKSADVNDLPRLQTRTVEEMDFKVRALERRFNWKVSEYLKEHHPSITGKVTKMKQALNMVRELMGESTGDEAAMQLANAVRDSLEEMRLMFNEAGGTMGKLENYGLPHVHNRRQIRRAGFEKWFEDIDQKLDWKKIENRALGKPFQAEGGDLPPLSMRERFLKEVYDNIIYGREVDNPTYGKPRGMSLVKRQSQSRQLHFKSADGWLDYNMKYGVGDPHKALMAHVKTMARDIEAMREFGPNPKLGLDYQRQLIAKRLKEKDNHRLFDVASKNGTHAERMLKIRMGGSLPQGAAQEWWATFFSTARHLMTSAMLDKAMISSVSDMNTMRLAAKSIGMNPANLVSRHMKLIFSGVNRDEALRAGWISDTLADPGAAVARFNAEYPAAEWAERLSNASMRIQGLAHWTDQAKTAFQMEFSGFLTSFVGKPMSEIHPSLLREMKKWGISEDDWKVLSDPRFLYKADNGATFLSPIYWREATDLPASKANDIFDKIQGMFEEQTEFAVPTESLYARGVVDMAGRDVEPGSILYEIGKSGLMFKSFAMTFTVNQIRRIYSIPTWKGRAAYGAQLVAGATVLGAISLQIGELLKGNNPQPMNRASFWSRAAMKGGGFGIIGDIAFAGSASWGGGLGSYVAGPVPQLLGDALGLTVFNAWQFARGEDTNFAAELSRAGKRYTPMGQTPILGPAIDRMVWDQLQLLLDPESMTAMRRSATKRKNLYGNDSWWLPGKALPSSPPDLGALFGG